MSSATSQANSPSCGDQRELVDLRALRAVQLLSRTARPESVGARRAVGGGWFAGAVCSMAQPVDRADAQRRDRELLQHTKALNGPNPLSERMAAPIAPFQG